MMIIQYMKINTLPDPKEMPRALSQVCAERQRKILAYQRLEDRLRSFAAGLLMKKLLRESGKSENDIEYNENGKPECSGLYFSISHSGNYAVAVTCDCPVGIDIQEINVKRIVLSALTDAEQRIVRESDDQADIFSKIWTMKEAYLKMLGESIAKLDEVPIGYENGCLYFEKSSVFSQSMSLNAHILTVVSQKDIKVPITLKEIFYNK